MSLLGQRLIQVQLAIIYWSAFSAKLYGASWLDGSAVYYATHRLFMRFPVPYLFDHLWTCCLLSWGTLLIEFSLCFLVWIKELRYLILLAGVILHLGLDWSLVLPQFEFVMLSCYWCFVDEKDLQKWMQAVKAFFAK